MVGSGAIGVETNTGDLSDLLGARIGRTVFTTTERETEKQYTSQQLQNLRYFRFLTNLGGTPWGGESRRNTANNVPGRKPPVCANCQWHRVCHQSAETIQGCVGPTRTPVSQRHHRSGPWLKNVRRRFRSPWKAIPRIRSLQIQSAGYLHHPHTANVNCHRTARLLRLPTRRRPASMVLAIRYRLQYALHPISQYELAQASARGGLRNETP